MMLQYSTYSVISPEGCASILWRSAEKKEVAAEALGITAGRLKQLGLIDELLEEPLGGAHRDPVATAASLKEAVIRHLDELELLNTEQLLARRAEKLAALRGVLRGRGGVVATRAGSARGLLAAAAAASASPGRPAVRGLQRRRGFHGAAGPARRTAPGEVASACRAHRPRSARTVRSWVRACRAVCRTLRVPFASYRLDLPNARGKSLEAVARSGRYAALAAALRPGEVLLTAHHLEDQLETVLLQLLRGAGLPGLAAMPAVAVFSRGVLVRPLLAQPRAQLRAWVQSRGLPCLEDPTNAEDTFDRNYLRHQVLPPIVSRWSGAAHTVARSARHVAEAQYLLETLARDDVARAADGAQLSVVALRALPLERRRNALRFWIGQSGHPVPDARRLEEIAVTLLAARVGANPEVRWGQVRVQRHSGRLGLDRVRPGAAAWEVTWDLRRKRRLDLPGGAGRLELVRSVHGHLDGTALPAQLTVRTRRGGERLRPRSADPPAP